VNSTVIYVRGTEIAFSLEKAKGGRHKRQLLVVVGEFEEEKKRGWPLRSDLTSPLFSQYEKKSKNNNEGEKEKRYIL